ncbi:DUF2501 domain-containing protein [Luteibacter sp. 22Crub2.1]|uniref:DUF2501 domain-containing protein n=1 Tax=Luteibacter sp. 22Crub2.1 TaxID=1283288 RepID=UPI0009A75167|nr:DUF2501 domain-containing protein [Luteibacter sp. 22Crub2.1]SKB39342.1 Protein of unknown function [Luteibacter sp. 22Crub2.1]
MKTAIAGIVLAATLASGSAAAAQLDSLKGMMGGSGSLTSGSASNAAGILQYCMTNNYLGGDSGASGVKDKLLGSLSGDHQAADNDAGSSSTRSMLGKFTGGSNKKTDTAPTQDKGYLDGARGILTSGDGKSLNLGGASGASSGNGDLKAQLTRKVCDAVLKQGRKMAGM